MALDHKPLRDGRDVATLANRLLTFAPSGRYGARFLILLSVALDRTDFRDRSFAGTSHYQSDKDSQPFVGQREPVNLPYKYVQTRGAWASLLSDLRPFPHLKLYIRLQELELLLEEIEHDQGFWSGLADA